MAQMFGYGDKGPEKDTAGYDVTCYVARGGILGSFHERGTSPINEPNAFGDYQVALTLASGICAALYAREKTGKGDRVVTSLFHQALWAMCLAGEGDEVVALSAGPAKNLSNSKICKDILSRGPARLELVSDDSLAGALPDVTAQVLAAAIKKIGFDLVLCGEGSGDLYAQQVGILLGEKLGAANINVVQSIAREQGALLVERALEDETEVLRIPLPAVLSLTSDINVPKIPTMWRFLIRNGTFLSAVTTCLVPLLPILRPGPMWKIPWAIICAASTKFCACPYSSPTPATAPLSPIPTCACGNCIITTKED